MTYRSRLVSVRRKLPLVGWCFGVLAVASFCRRILCPSAFTEDSQTIVSPKARETLKQCIRIQYHQTYPDYATTLDSGDNTFRQSHSNVYLLSFVSQI